MKRFFAFLQILAVILFAACGTSGDIDISDDVPTGLYPTISRVDPAAGKAGDTITIYGFGFSEAAGINVVIIGNASVAATAYNILAAPTATEIESLTATVPTGATVGPDSVAVLVNDNVSNSDILFTVTP